MSVHTLLALCIVIQKALFPKKSVSYELYAFPQDGFSKDDFSTFASAFEATKWHEHLRSILVAAAHVSV